MVFLALLFAFVSVVVTVMMCLSLLRLEYAEAVHAGLAALASALLAGMASWSLVSGKSILQAYAPAEWLVVTGLVWLLIAGTTFHFVQRKVEGRDKAGDDYGKL